MMKGLLWLDGLDVLSLPCKGSVASSFTPFRRTSNVMIYWLRVATVPLGISVAHLPNNGSVAQLSLWVFQLLTRQTMAPWRNCIAHQISALRVGG